MAKPDTASGYGKEVTENCERVLITLLRGLGPWKESVYLIGGLTPRYLVPKLPPGKSPHAGTGDVDIVVRLEVLAQTDAYQTLEENLKRMGFEKAKNDRGETQSWRWQTRTESDQREHFRAQYSPFFDGVRSLRGQGNTGGVAPWGRHSDRKGEAC
jgi:hypothetical protein